MAYGTDTVPKPAPSPDGQTWEQTVTGGSDPEDDIPVRGPSGAGGTVKRKDLAHALDIGFTLEHPDQTHERDLQRAYGDSEVEAGLLAAGSMVTGGVFDGLTGERGREVRKRNEVGNTVGSVAGALLPVGAGGLISGAGKAVGAAVGERAGAGLLGRLAAPAARGAVEGGLFGAQAGVSEIGLSKNPVDWESGAATIGSNVLGGAVLGGGIGVGAKLFEEGAIAARNMANARVDAIAAKEGTLAARGEHPDIASMDRDAVAKAIPLEEEAVRVRRSTTLTEGKAAREAEASALAQDAYADAVAYKDHIKPRFIPVAGEAGGILRQTKRGVMRGVEDAESFVESRGGGLEKTLRRREGALKTALADADDVIAKAEAERAGLLESMPTAKPAGPASAVPGTLDDLPAGFRDFSFEAGDTFPAGKQVNRGMPSWEAISERGKDRLGRPVYEPTSQLFVASADDFARAGLYGDPVPTIHQTKVAGLASEMAKGEAGFAATKMPPVDLIMLPDGRFIANDGNHRIRAALAQGNGREIVANVRPYTKGSHYGFEHHPERLEVLSPTGPALSEKVVLSPEQSKLYGRFADVKVPKDAPNLSVTADELGAFRSALENGELHPPRLQRVLDAQAELEMNQALQGKLRGIRQPPPGSQLAEMDAALEHAKAGLTKETRLEALKAHKEYLSKDSLGRKVARGGGAMAGGSLGFAVGGPLGAAAGGMVGQEAGARLFDRLVRKISTGNASRAKTISATVTSMFATGAGRVATAAAKTAPLLTKILPAIKYASPDYVDGVMGPDHNGPSKSVAVTEFRQRARELNSLTQRQPDGTFTMRMRAREELNARNQALWTIDADAANGIEKTHAARIAFLAGKLPRNPAPPTLQIGPDDWEPSRAQIAKFARYMDAVETPENVIKRMASATMTPEDAEVLRSVYPQMYEQVRGQIYEQIAQVREKLPYAKRLALSIYLDIPVDRAVTPEAIGVYQSLYNQNAAQAPGGMPSPGGAPKKFTSNEKPTRSQRAAEG